MRWPPWTPSSLRPSSGTTPTPPPHPASPPQPLPPPPPWPNPSPSRLSWAWQAPTAPPLGQRHPPQKRTQQAPSRARRHKHPGQSPPPVSRLPFSQFAAAFDSQVKGGELPSPAFLLTCGSVCVPSAPADVPRAPAVSHILFAPIPSTSAAPLPSAAPSTSASTSSDPPAAPKPAPAVDAAASGGVVNSPLPSSPTDANGASLSTKRYANLVS